MELKKIIIDLIISNACNKKCDYCCIKFNGKTLQCDNIDFLLNYLNIYSDQYSECVINFFGGEPLLNYKNIVYFIEKNTNKKISYMLGTNGILLTEDKLDFFIKHNVKIYLSFHADNTNSYYDLLLKKYLINHKLIEINFIVSPINIKECYKKIDEVISFGFTKINIIPVMLTMKWSIDAIKELSFFIKYVDEKYINQENLFISKYSFFDGIIQDKTFVVDYDLNIFQDSSDELYIGKQFNDLGSDLSNEILAKTLLGNLKDGNDINYFVNKHSVKEVFNLIYKLPKKMGYVNDYFLIYKIMNRNKQNLKRGSYMIFGANLSN